MFWLGEKCAAALELAAFAVFQPIYSLFLSKVHMQEEAMPCWIGLVLDNIFYFSVIYLREMCPKCVLFLFCFH